MQERDNLLKIFEGTKKAVESGDTVAIDNLSNQTTNTASLTHDPDNIAAAVTVYSLGKILERENYRDLPGWKTFYGIYLKAINNIIIALKQDDEKSYRKNIEMIQQAIGKISGKLKKYVQDVFTKAKINKASRIYEHGISMEKTAKLLGVSMYDLADYVGESGNVPEIPGKTIPERQRIKTLMGMFS